MSFEPNSFFILGNDMIKRRAMLPTATETDIQRFRSVFGTSPQICSYLWDMCSYHTDLPKDSHPKHLLWSLMFLKLYRSESAHTSIAGGVDEKTFRKWSWILVSAISFLVPYVVSKTN